MLEKQSGGSVTTRKKANKKSRAKNSASNWKLAGGIALVVFLLGLCVTASQFGAQSEAIMNARSIVEYRALLQDFYGRAFVSLLCIPTVVFVVAAFVVKKKD
ncbi:MAG: hypothetical protein KJZ53_08135 [Anaerolineales bacterium]|nr:hypothetical protein [Anaerolineales bacterium]